MSDLPPLPPDDQPDSWPQTSSFPINVPMARPLSTYPAVQARPIDPMLLPGARRTSMLVELLLFAVVFCGVQFIIAIAFMISGSEEELPPGMMLLWGSIVPGLLTMGGVIGIVRMRGGTLAGLGLRFPTASTMIVGTIASALISLVVNSVVRIGIMQIVENSDPMDNLENMRSMIPNWRLGWFGLFFMFVGLYEELMFRGFMMTRLRRLCGSWTAAVIISSVIFGAIHMTMQSWTAALSITAAAFVWATTTVLCRSIWPAVFAHALFDFAQTAMFLWLEQHNGA